MANKRFLLEKSILHLDLNPFTDMISLLETLIPLTKKNITTFHVCHVFHENYTLFKRKTKFNCENKKGI